MIAWRAFLCSYGEGGHTALLLCQQALTLLSATNNMFRALIYYAQFLTYYASLASNELDTAEELLRASLLPLASHQPALTIGFMGAIAARMIGAGRLKELHELTEQAILLGTRPGGLVLPDVGWPMVWQAEILRERNQLDAALDLVREAIALCEQGISIGLLAYLFYAHAVLLRIHFSRRDLDAACCALQQLEHICMSMQEIGQELAIAIDTVKRHVSHIYAKLGVQSRMQAVTRALSLGLLDGEL